MTTYETLDRIADMVNPVFGVATLLWAWIARGHGRLGRGPRAGILGNAATLASVAMIYLIGALDKKMGLWAAMGLDYSTHTAVCVACIVSLWWIDVRARIPATVVGLAYAALMLFQKYHSVADIATTAAIIVGTSYVICAAVAKFAVSERLDEREGHPAPLQGDVKQ
jgi:hypothetical protein